MPSLGRHGLELGQELGHKCSIMLVHLLLSVAVPAAATRPALSTWLRAVPLARYSPWYYLTAGQFRRCPAGDAWASLPIESVLELAAGCDSYWSQEVAKARPDVIVTAADRRPPLACGLCNVKQVAANNADLAAFARGRDASGPYDLIFGSHMLCTCKRVVLGTGAPTCGGLPIERESASAFVAALSALLRPGRGIAVFDHEGGFPFGLEAMLENAACTNGLGFAVRHGPGFTNVNYVFWSGDLVDDVSCGVFQRASRAIDVITVALVLLATSLDQPPDGLDFILGILAVRYICPLFDVFSLDDLKAKVGLAK